jgi:hypothetical protein
MLSEPFGWLGFVVAVCSLIVGIIQVWQGRTPRRLHRRTRVKHVRTLKMFGITYTTSRIESSDNHQS